MKFDLLRWKISYEIFLLKLRLKVLDKVIEGFAKSLAAECAPCIRVNVIAPSLTDTPLADKFLNNDIKKEKVGNRHPLKRPGNPEDIANSTAFLLSDDSSWVTGQILGVDGGMSTLNTSN